MSEKIKIRVDTSNDKTKIKVMDESNNVVCYITYKANMNSLGIYNSEKDFVKWVPLG